MKTIIAGSRNIANYDFVCQCIEESCFDITEVVSGTALGVDELGERWAKENNIPIKQFPADWKKYGKSAGFIRNLEMALYADALIACWDNESKGTHNMIDVAMRENIKTFVRKLNKWEREWRE